MELKHIKELMASMGRTGLKKLVIKKEGFELELEREGAPSTFDILDEEGAAREFQALRRIPTSLPGSQDLPPMNSPPKPEVPGTFITSPMVGTFYSAPSPDDATFVKIGDKVEKNTVVCIVEAMKVMNEIKAGHAGTIAEVLVESASPVEFGTKLFKIV